MNSRKLGFVTSLVFVSHLLGSNVVTDWNAVASASIVATGGKSAWGRRSLVLLCKPGGVRCRQFHHR